MDINENIVGKFQNRNVKSYELINDYGFRIKVLNFGGVITDIIAPDRNGVYENVILRYKDISTYEKNPSYLGAIVGRTAGRICDGRVDIDGRTIELNRNYGLHQGHGGNIGFSKRFWNVDKVENKDKVSVRLTYLSPDGEENYPGNLWAEIEYEVNNAGELIIRYRGKSDKDTLVNMTNHSYFNLSGNAREDILKHNLRINADYICELDKTQVPTGNLLEVTGTPFDFRLPKEIGKDIECDHDQINIGSGYDHPWILKKSCGVKVHLYHEASGRTMDVCTDQKAAVIYTMNFPDDELLNTGKMARRRDGICFETQSPPIGRNNTFLKDSILKKNQLYKRETIFRFYTL